MLVVWGGCGGGVGGDVGLMWRYVGENCLGREICDWSRMQFVCAYKYVFNLLSQVVMWWCCHNW